MERGRTYQDFCEFCGCEEDLVDIPNGKGSDFLDGSVTICKKCWEKTGVVAGWIVEKESVPD
jgi:hypothetical protein